MPILLRHQSKDPPAQEFTDEYADSKQQHEPWLYAVFTFILQAVPSERNSETEAKSRKESFDEPEPR